jgi:hypothetical protein
MRHRCERRSVWYAPPTGWVTCAGRSPGLRVVVCRPAFPVSQWPMRTQARRLQLRGQPRFRPQCTAGPCSLLPPRSYPRNQHGTRIPHADERVNIGSFHAASNDVQFRRMLRARYNGCANTAVAPALQNNGRALVIVARTGLRPWGDPWTPQAGCRVPSRLRILPATQYDDCQYKTGKGADFEATAFGSASECRLSPIQAQISVQSCDLIPRGRERNPDDSA